MIHPDNRILFRAKKKELSSHGKTWQNLKCMLLSERNHSEKATYCMNPTVGHSGKDSTMETVKRGVVAGAGRMNRQSTEDF